jgi:hypothetical protein
MNFYLPGGATFCNTQTDANGDASCKAGIPANAGSGTSVSVAITAQGTDGSSASTEITFTVQ